MRKEINRYARAHALFVALQKNFFQCGQPAAVHFEDYLVYHPFGKQLGKAGEALLFARSARQFRAGRATLRASVGQRRVLSGSPTNYQMIGCSEAALKDADEKGKIQTEGREQDTVIKNE